MINEQTKGVYTIAVTPFLPDGSIDWDSVDRMVDFYIEKGASGLTILGMMGEAGKLTAAESEQMVARVVARSTVPVIVGVSAPGFAAIKTLADGSMDKGAAGVMVAPPGSLRTDDQIRTYYRGIADILGDIPFVLQDFPLVTGVVISPSVILQIIADCPTCMMLKHEDWPGLEKISALRAASDAGARRISILCGNGGLYLLEEMLRGADGAMTGFAYPEMMAQVIAAAATDIERARDIFDAYMPMVRYEAQPGMGLAIRKYTLAQRGVIAHPTLRKPGAVLSDAACQEVNALASRQVARLRVLGL
ncbi:dihydrodipicolinate synthase family protein [Yoonia sediminilitoris]|uniref:4-hydroxy-tetrahydrodipicolinate synthase n=1 Tax=Yoonia sediminilitoris TaxID=1286148 RepID=A0A2T6KHM6_9RHOB|nr:dihydrodipicolinate synthase family protein [Yoonia sediminilitoris]PUB14961.1 4-hydroxy-tetrahydrodipicolinate synthase [Yoonia sediminilitoris]RCW95677.1 4-hydroxy-tetrahydrodipicolinate synthase [Yoonia sediminilitoris]